MHDDLILVRVAPELLEHMVTNDSAPVVILGIDKQADGTYDMVLRSVEAERDRYREALEKIASDRVYRSASPVAREALRITVLGPEGTKRVEEILQRHAARGTRMGR